MDAPPLDTAAPPADQDLSTRSTPRISRLSSAHHEESPQLCAELCTPEGPEGKGGKRPQNSGKEARRESENREEMKATPLVNARVKVGNLKAAMSLFGL